MLMGRAHELVLMGRARELMLMRRSHEHMLKDRDPLAHALGPGFKDLDAQG